MQRQSYLTGSYVTGPFRRRFAVGHRWEIYHRATGKKICAGKNPQQCYRRFQASAEQEKLT